MKLSFLGTGTSVGVPVIGCTCDTCRSNDPHDRRLRCSALVETDTTRILIDTGPDFREQMLTQPFRKIDAVLLTHIHYDHVGGIDDLRPFCQFGEVNVYADGLTANGLMATVPYCFAEHRYPGAPAIRLHRLTPHRPFRINELEIIPFTVWHGKMPITAYRIQGSSTLVYITDMKTIDDEDVDVITTPHSPDLLVVNALRFEGVHHSHQLVDDAIDFARHVKAPQTYLIHSCHDIGRHDEANAKLPPDIRLAYDGQVVEL